MEIHTLQSLKDNYIYLIEAQDRLLVIDPGEAQPVLDFLQTSSRNRKYFIILITHHHSDHIGGVEKLLPFHPIIYGPKFYNHFKTNVNVNDGDRLEWGDLSCQVIATPGHTLDHMIYYFPKIHSLFSGDTLFSAGCGRLFEGSALQMYRSLEKIKQLPRKTKIYFGHEYTMSNLRFALTIDPENKAISSRIKAIEAQKITTPTSLEMELLINPFLRVENSAIRKNLGMENSSDLEVFTKIRQLKDGFS